MPQAKQKIQFFSWPEGPRKNWYRQVKTVANLSRAKHGDLLTIIYPSGTKVRARIVYLRRLLDSNTVIVQTEEESGRRPCSFINGVLARSIKVTHERKRR